MRVNRRGVAMLATLVSVLACAPADEPPPATHPASASAGAGEPGPASAGAGEPGIGDPDFPEDGNGGYDVSHYDLAIDYSPTTKRLDGVTTVKATATHDLSSFNLDLTGLNVRTITVDDAQATFGRKGSELTVRPAEPIGKNDRFTATITYSGVPKPAKDSANLGTYGFIPTSDGAFVASEPNGSKTWFPNNDHPADKATFDFTVTVPAGVTALANGEQIGQPTTAGGKTTFRWRERHPMASYLATATMGKFELRQGSTSAGIPNLAATDPKFKGSLDSLYTTSAEVTDYWSTVFGPYPFSSTGGVVDDYSAGYALENQTKPLYGGFHPDEAIIAHELAHQWFGNSLTISRWKDLWLNEGFATYAEWLWSEHKGKKSAEALFNENHRRSADDAIWKYPPGRARPGDLFNQSVYTRGGMTLHALRKSIGDATFFTLLKAWTAEHRYGYVTTEGFVALAERLSGKDLGPLFDAWLFQPRRPA
ncbi:Peptidase family M1 [Nonomuraea solani]|uniref:Aminopeptidase N n=1 Tax=Nonomuraea solani TaxID=1144553 RepID=A0A1H6ENQ3_9ACTN|nr:M1 family metallopeptidase [Nonomuraea solani]SEG99023.1 Peptidase family M1 [Nonomuraea solani]